MRIVYLHGFASSPASSKARYFAGKFEEAGIEFDAPQLDEGDFRNMTISGMLRVVERSVNGRPAILMGSSLGGYLAGLYASRHPGEVERLVLLAPAFEFPTRWQQRFSEEERKRWKEEGALAFYHYGAKTEQLLAHRFAEDGLRYEDEPDFGQPALILHGTGDPVVPVEISRRFVARHPNARLREFASGHELTDVLDGLWAETECFLWR
jgi:pimeloyl-ACP methyl ester carboxylesterase